MVALVIIVMLGLRHIACVGLPPPAFWRSFIESKSLPTGTSLARGVVTTESDGSAIQGRLPKTREIVRRSARLDMDEPSGWSVEERIGRVDNG